MKTKLFVYGTLKRGNPLYHSYQLKEKAEFLGEDSVKGELYTLGWFPVLFEKGDHVTDVPGDVFMVPDDIYVKIKSLEEASGYKTKLTKTRNGHEAMVFYFQDEAFRILRNRIREF